MQAEDVMDFWFEEAGEEKWFAKDEAFDEAIRQRFEQLHQKAAAGELWKWRETIEGRLAEIIVLDQFSRNMYRNQPKAFSTDGIALVLAQEALNIGDLSRLKTEQRQFIYMPFMHSESLAMQQISYKLFQEDGLEASLPYAKEHLDIIARFGRFPHRNAALKRESTEEERDFMKEHDGF